MYKVLAYAGSHIFVKYKNKILLLVLDCNCDFEEEEVDMDEVIKSISKYGFYQKNVKFKSLKELVLFLLKGHAMYADLVTHNKTVVNVVRGAYIRE